MFFRSFWKFVRFKLKTFSSVKSNKIFIYNGLRKNYFNIFIARVKSTFFYVIYATTGYMMIPG